MRKIRLHFSGKPVYRWLWGNRYISNRTAWLLIDVLHIAESD